MSKVIVNSLFANEPEMAAVAEVKKPQAYTIPQIKLSYVRESPVLVADNVTDSTGLASAFRASYAPGEIDFQEVIKVAYLNRRLKVIGIQTIGQGNEIASVCDTHSLFAGALLCRATEFAICHNHPSGGLRPSIADDNLTKKLNEMAKIMEFRMIDHIILTSESYYSYRDEGKYL